MTIAPPAAATTTRASLGRTAALLIAGAVVVNVAFLGLGTAFD
jgi:hypothetical protein